MNINKTSRQALYLTLLSSFFLSSCGGGSPDDANNGDLIDNSAPKAWGTAMLIENDDAGRALSPQIAVDNNGKAIAVWLQFDAQQRIDLWASHFDGSNWTNPELIEKGNENPGPAQIAVDKNGKAIAVWPQSDGTNMNIWANRFDGSAWGKAELIEAVDQDAQNPQIAFDNNGNAIAVWRQQATKDAEPSIWANHFDGNNWGDAELIETGNETALFPQITFDGNDNAIAVWAQFLDATPSEAGIWTNRFDGSDWGTPVLIDDGNGDARSPQIAADNNGNAAVVWRQFDGARYNIWANRYNGSDWGEAELIETDNAGGARDPQIAFDNNGNAIAVWQQDDGENENILANRFDGSTWGSPELIEDADWNAASPQIAFDNKGNAIAVWSQRNFFSSSIWANRFDGKAWGSAELIEDDDSGDAYKPQVIFDVNGNAIAVWEQSDGTRTSIWANLFK